METLPDGTRLGLFQGFGIELEYMLVDAGTLDVAPVADRLLEAESGASTAECLRGAFAWNNELARHIIEFKTNGPSVQLAPLAEGFAAEVRHANLLLAEQGCRLLPTGMHPWMDPRSETVLWQDEDREIYAAFDRIFFCQGHGWSNLQSMHLNLPFANDAEFGRLHAAIRFLLPILPGLCASSPIRDGRVTGTLDNRLAAYRGNCARVPSVTAAVVPEPVYTIGAYHERILQRIYRDMASLDPAGVLRHEWINARGVIARFERMALEIRVLDTQECPAADLAFAQLIVATLQALCEETWVNLTTIQSRSTTALALAFDSVTREAERTAIHDRRYLEALGFKRSAATVAEAWAGLADRAAAAGRLDAAAERAIEHYLRHGTLATRILSALPDEPSREELRAVFRRLADCLAGNELFSGRD
jgi:gamma-glutamyl:cysteine ligase YbdK (ATP-grasp superfamily)